MSENQDIINFDKYINKKVLYLCSSLCIWGYLYWELVAGEIWVLIPFPSVNISKVNVIANLDVELTYAETILQQFRDYTMAARGFTETILKNIKLVFSSYWLLK